MSHIDHPANRQDLFEKYIERSCSVIGGFYSSVEYWRLAIWAKEYATHNNLILPTDPSVYGLWVFGSDREEKEELLRDYGIDVQSLNFLEWR